MSWAALGISVLSLVVAAAAFLRTDKRAFRAEIRAERQLELQESEASHAAAARLPELRIVAASIVGQGRANELPRFSVDVRALASGVDAADVHVEVTYGGQESREADESGLIRAGDTRRFVFTAPVAWADADRRLDFLMPGVQIRAVDRDTGVDAAHDVPFV